MKQWKIIRIEAFSRQNSHQIYKIAPLKEGNKNRLKGKNPIPSSDIFIVYIYFPSEKKGKIVFLKKEKYGILTGLMILWTKDGKNILKYK